MPKDKRDDTQDDPGRREEVKPNREPREDDADEPWARRDAWGNDIPNTPFSELLLREGRNSR